MRAFAGAIFALSLMLLADAGFAQDASQVPIQLRLTSAMTGKVDYYLSLPGGSPTYVGSIQPGATIEVESRQGQVWLFALNRVPFQNYTVRAEKFQHLTVAPKEQQRAPQVAAEYQGSSDTTQPPEQIEPDAVPQQTTSGQQAPAAGTQPPSGSGSGSGLVWSYNRYDNADDPSATESQLVYGIPETDAIQVVAACSAAAEGGAPRVVLSAEVSRLQAESPAKVRFVAQGLDRTIDGVVVRDASGEGLQGAGLAIPANDPLWKALPRLASVNYSVAGQAATSLPLGGIAGPVASFLRDCASYSGSPPALTSGGTQAPPDSGTQAADNGAQSLMPATSLFADDAGTAGSPAASPATSEDTCKKLAKARSTDGGKSVRVTFVNRTNELRTVNEIQSDGTQVEYAQLDGGQSFKANTISTHLWMMTDGPGNCIEMMVPSPGQPTFEITRPSPGFGGEGD